MDNQKVGSPRATDSPRRLPDNRAMPLSPRGATPRVLEKEREALLVEMGRGDSLYQTMFDIGELIRMMGFAIAKECAKTGMPGKAEGMQERAAQISNALCQVDTYFDRNDFANCKIYVDAAKANQIGLLVSIDGLKQDPDGDQSFSEAHDQCVQLGHKITMLTLLVSERLSKQQEQQQQQPGSPRPSSPKYAPSPERHKNQKTKKTDASILQSPTAQRAPRSPDNEASRGRLEKMPSPPSGKRAQGDEDSPQFKNSPAKRHKAQATEKTVSNPTRKPSDAMTPSPGPADARSSVAPGGTATVPKLDWSKAKPANTGPHSPLSTTPRTSKHARTESKGHEKQDVGNPVTPSPAPAHHTRTVASGDEHPASPPTSPSSARSGSKQESPRKGVSSPPKPLRPQPKPRPPSMLFLSPPALPGATARNHKVRDADGVQESDVTTLQGPPSTPGATSAVSTTTTTTTTDAGPSGQPQADA